MKQFGDFSIMIKDKKKMEVVMNIFQL